MSNCKDCKWQNHKDTKNCLSCNKNTGYTNNFQKPRPLEVWVLVDQYGEIFEAGSFTYYSKIEYAIDKIDRYETSGKTLTPIKLKEVK